MTKLNFQHLKINKIIRNSQIKKISNQIRKIKNFKMKKIDLQCHLVKLTMIMILKNKILRNQEVNNKTLLIALKNKI